MNAHFREKDKNFYRTTCPERQGWMMIRPANIVYCLLSYVVKKLLIDRIQRVAEFKLGPQQHPFLIRNIIDKVRGVSTTGPNTKHILVPCRDRIKQLAHLLLCHARPKRIRWDEVRALGVELMAVDFKMPLLSDIQSAQQD